MYHFIHNHKQKFGLRWLCRKLQVSSSAYYNYLKQRKQSYYERKAHVQRFMVEGFHKSKGTMGTS